VPSQYHQLARRNNGASDCGDVTNNNNDINDDDINNSDDDINYRASGNVNDDDNNINDDYNDIGDINDDYDNDDFGTSQADERILHKVLSSALFFTPSNAFCRDHSPSVLLSGGLSLLYSVTTMMVN